MFGGYDVLIAEGYAACDTSAAREFFLPKAACSYEIPIARFS
jgi:hypothetical protein